MSANLYKAPGVNFGSTSLNGAIDNSVTTITLNSTTNLKSPGYIVIDRQDANGTNTPSAREVVSYTGISGNDLTGCTRAADGSIARSHNDGALVEPVFTIGMWNDQQDFLAVSLATVDGTLRPLSAATVTTLHGTNLLYSTATVTSLNVVNQIPGVGGQFYWSKSGSLATVLAATATDTHFPLQRATKNLTINSFYVSLISAPSLAPAEMDITYGSGPTGDFTSIFSVRPFVDIGEYTTASAATPGTLSLTSLASGTFLRAEIRKHGGAGGLAANLQVTSR